MERRVMLVATAFLASAITAVAVGWFLGSLPLLADHTPPAARMSPTTTASPAARISPTATAPPVPMAMVDRRWFGDPPIWQPSEIPGARIESLGVNGTTQTELILNLNANGPRDSNGGHWGVEGSSVSASVCYSPRTFNPSQDVLVRLPRWSPVADGSVGRDLVVRWNALAQVT